MLIITLNKNTGYFMEQENKESQQVVYVLCRKIGTVDLDDDYATGSITVDGYSSIVGVYSNLDLAVRAAVVVHNESSTYRRINYVEDAYNYDERGSAVSVLIGENDQEFLLSEIELITMRVDG